jgi:transposase-like protein
MEGTLMKLNEKGQCPVCKIKPLVYKRQPHKFCHRCDRAFDLQTGEQINNWAWLKIGNDFRLRRQDLEKSS